MNTFVVASLALALVLTVLALVRQVRLRRALEKLLRVVLSRWRSHAENEFPQDPDSSGRRPGHGDGL
jgi:hypothetical protein